MKKLILFFLAAACVFAKPLEPVLIKKGADSNNTMLLIGGIQGDEPGGFLAASLVATDYEISKGSLWIVPNLNFPSIIQRSRGTKGDMNRKFANVDKNDPDYEAVMWIKELIANENVSLILNLHDGSGFFRDKFINNDKNPDKWGNTAIIDQSALKEGYYADLQSVAERVVGKVNENLLNEEHRYRVKNTRTSEGDLEMLKSLTYYAVTKGKSAFANEASKNLNAEQRTFYHLNAIEEYFRLVGIEFSRPFELSVKGVKSAIEKPVEVVLFDKFLLHLKNPRANLKFIPIPEGAIKYSASNPVTAVVKEGASYKVQYGNRVLTRLTPEFFEYSALNIGEVGVIIDGERKTVKLGSKIAVLNDFEIEKIDGVRVNAIGFSSNQKDESGVKIARKSLSESYSVDKNGKIFRVEFYESGAKDKFLGMFLAEFK
jgi:purine nucleoside phosphorylase